MICNCIKFLTKFHPSISPFFFSFFPLSLISSNSLSFWQKYCFYLLFTRILLFFYLSFRNHLIVFVCLIWFPLLHLFLFPFFLSPCIPPFTVVLSFSLFYSIHKFIFRKMNVYLNTAILCIQSVCIHHYFAHPFLNESYTLKLAFACMVDVNRSILHYFIYNSILFITE